MSLTSSHHSRYGLIVKVRIGKETICLVCQFQKDDRVSALGIGRHQLGRIPTTTYDKSKFLRVSPVIFFLKSLTTVDVFFV